MLATMKCPKCKKHLLEFEQIHAMRIIREVDGKKIYNVRCENCGDYTLPAPKDTRPVGGKMKVSSDGMGTGTFCGGSAHRQNARNVLKDIIRRKENELFAFQALDKCIPWGELSKEDEGELWGYFIKQNT